MNKLQIFENEQFGKVRVVMKQNDPWFVAKDVCDVFGDTNYRRSISRLDEDEKGVSQIATPGGMQNMGIVNESGLYALLFSMQPQKANADDEKINKRVQSLKSFKRWITHEVIPAIRKTGAYIPTFTRNGEIDYSMFGEFQFAIPRTMADALQLAANQQQQLEEQASKVLFADSVAGSKGSCLVGELAKIIKQNGVDIGQNRLFEWLREHEYLGKSGCNYNLPTQKAMDLGTFEIKKTVITHASGDTETKRTCKVTGKGQIYFVDKICRSSLFTTTA